MLYVTANLLEPCHAGIHRPGTSSCEGGGGQLGVTSDEPKLAARRCHFLPYLPLVTVGAREVWQVAVSLSEGGILSVHRDLQEREMSHGRWGAAH